MPATPGAFTCLVFVQLPLIDRGSTWQLPDRSSDCSALPRPPLYPQQWRRQPSTEQLPEKGAVQVHVPVEKYRGLSVRPMCWQAGRGSRAYHKSARHRSRSMRCPQRGGEPSKTDLSDTCTIPHQLCMDADRHLSERAMCPKTSCYCSGHDNCHQHNHAHD